MNRVSEAVQRNSGERLAAVWSELEFDRGGLGWSVSLGVHAALVVAFTLITFYIPAPQAAVTLDAVAEDEQIEVSEHLEIDDAPQPQIGALSALGNDAGGLNAALQSDLLELTTDPLDSDSLETPSLDVDPTSPTFSIDRTTRGVAGAAATGAEGAIDRLTAEILRYMEQGPTLVVWLFDQSGSLDRQRREVVDRFDRVYRELGVLESADAAAFRGAGKDHLLSAVVAFGQQSAFLTPDPTTDVEAMKRAVEGIETDESGDEMVFSALLAAAKRYERMRTGRERRNVLFVVFTDEKGDDAQRLEDAVVLLRRREIPVYVVGVPAPFGQVRNYVKWVDPDPKFDQTPQRAEVSQGPETLYPERLQTAFTNDDEDPPLDSGFGPYALTRLCYETGGIYFAVHPNRRTDRDVGFGEVAQLAAELRRFFDPEVMRRYTPDYSSYRDVDRMVQENGARAALVAAAQQDGVERLEQPRLSFPYRNEADFARLLTEAQRAAAKLQPRVDRLYAMLREGEEDRASLTGNRWQAGYDLAMGQVLAMKVRTESYNALLAQAKGGMTFEDERHDTWRLTPSNDVEVGSALARLGEQAREYLERVIRMHPDTPWAYLAQRELNQPLSWRWEGRYTGVNEPPRVAAGGNNAPNPNLQPRVAPPPRRPPPRL